VRGESGHDPPDSQVLENLRREELRERLRGDYVDVMAGTPPHLPPMRDVNHSIPLIDESVDYKYHLSRCADAYKGELLAKLQTYTANGWWEARSATQAAPMIITPKKNGKIRTVVDARQRNANTHRDVTPLPDQDAIRMDVARAKYRSKIDLSDAYEQVRVVEEDVWKTAFSTIYGTFVSHVMQQGDCNAPATFQRLMTHILRTCIGRTAHAYIDDIFVFSNTLEDHERHLREVLDILRREHLFVKPDVE
jgi:hypothetical protein